MTQQINPGNIIRKNLPLFAVKNIKLPPDTPFRFTDHEFLRAMYEDYCHEQVIMKAAQMGVTTYYMIKNFWMAAAFGAETLYTLPTTRLLNTFVNDRLKKLIIASKLGEEVGFVDNVAVKHFGKGTLRFASSVNENDLTSNPACYCFIDEVDRCFAPHLPLIPKRLNHAPIYFWGDEDHRGGLTYTSTPTLPGIGIDYLYKKGTQNQYYQKCEHCGKWQTLEFRKNIVEEIETGIYKLLDRKWQPNCGRDIHVYCVKCKKPINRLTQGEWQSAYPDRRVHSWHLTRLYSKFTTIANLWETYLDAIYNPDELAEFFRSDLGLPFVSADTLYLDDNVLHKAIADVPPLNLNNIGERPKYIFVGVDIGSVLNVTVGYPRTVKENEEIIVAWAGECKNFEELQSKVYDRLAPNQSAVDALPEIHEVRKLQQENNFVWACRYPRSQYEKAWIRLDDEKRFADLDRTQAMDEVLAAITGGRLKFHRAIKEVPGFMEHLKAPVRTIERPSADKGKSGTSSRVVWREGAHPDHYFHSLVYLLAAAWIARRRPSLLGNIDTGGVRREADNIAY